MTSLDDPAQQDPNYESTIAKSILNSGGRIPIGVSKEDATRMVSSFLAGEREADDASKQPAPSAPQQTIVGHQSGAGNRHVVNIPATYIPKQKVGDPSSQGGSFQVTVEDVSGYAPGAGVPMVNSVNVLTFDINNFEIYDGGGGQCIVKLKSCPATCP